MPVARPWFVKSTACSACTQTHALELLHKLFRSSQLLHLTDWYCRQLDRNVTHQQQCVASCTQGAYVTNIKLAVVTDRFAENSGNKIGSYLWKKYRTFIKILAGRILEKEVPIKLLKSSGCISRSGLWIRKGMDLVEVCAPECSCCFMLCGGLSRPRPHLTPPLSF